MHFLVEPETLEALDGRRVFVAERDGTAIGFTVLSPVPNRNGYLTEQFVRGRRAPNGTVELALYCALKKVADEGAEYVTMGIVPLSQHSEDAGASNPVWLRLLTRWVRSHGRRFYNFDGLDAFTFRRAGQPLHGLCNLLPFNLGIFRRRVQDRGIRLRGPLRVALKIRRLGRFGFRLRTDVAGRFFRGIALGRARIEVEERQGHNSAGDQEGDEENA